MSDYERVARAIDYIAGSATEQPSLDEIAAHVHLSPFHFQRLFSRWAGVTPKRFLQALTVERAKALLASADLPLLDVAHATGLSGPSRLHDHFVGLEAVTPAEYRTGGAGVTIRYGVAVSPFGDVFVAATARGVCRLEFVDPDSQASTDANADTYAYADIRADADTTADADTGTDTRTDAGVHTDATDAAAALAGEWPAAHLVEDAAGAARIAHRLFTRKQVTAEPLSLLVRGTNFQISVWRALLEIPAGRLASYHDIARAIGRPDAARAVGRAVGANPVAFAIPCHRVIRASGGLGGYRWGLTRKRAIQAWEAVS